MLHDDALEQRRRDTAIPDAFGIHDHDWPAAANTKARRLSSLDAIGPEQESLALQQRWQQLIQLAPAVVRRTEAAHTYEHVTCVGLHARTHSRGTHGGNLV